MNMNPMQMIQQMAGGGNNQLGQIMNMIGKGGMNPQTLINTMIQQNPQLKQVLPLVKGKDNKQLEETFNNLCKERGIKPEDFIKNLGITK